MQAGNRFAVVGGTGRVGRHVVDALRTAGRDVVAISRSTGVDVITGEGLDDALAGVECIVDAATGPSAEEAPATEFFTTAARNLHAAGERAGVQRIVVVSIIGTDRFTAGYGAAKLAHEQAHFSAPIPVRVLRAAQFHEFVTQLMDWGTQGDVCAVPRMRTQLVAARAVGEALAELAVTPFDGGAPIREIAGPREEQLVEMAALLAERRGDGVRVQGVDAPGPERAVYESGGLLPGPDATLAGPTFADWLETDA
jgi:uncharacterized protein YbjT (DUF2867 family)